MSRARDGRAVVGSGMAGGRILLEIALESLEDAVVARRAGADRIELCAALDLGGLTPSIGAVRTVCRAVSVPVLVMIRPRSGGFCYTPGEQEVMSRDIEAALEAGAAGVVFGVLSDDQSVDAAACRRLLSYCRGCDAVFHRAFDRVRDPFEALERLVDLGFRRVLTSGQQPDVTPPSSGAALVRGLIERAAGRIEVLPASGIRAGNVERLLQATGCTQVHAACRAVRRDASGARPGAPSFRFGVGDDDARYSATDAAQVGALRHALDAVTGHASID